jgi:TetR/AcrR family transcriptional regulator
MSKTGIVKQNILAAALALFSAKGYEGTSVGELVSMVGLTKPTLYYYFVSKEGLFEAVCRENYARLNDVIAKSITYPANPDTNYDGITKSLTNIGAAYFSFAAENEMFYRLSMANLYMPPSSPMFEVARKYHFKQYEIVGKLFEEMARFHGNLRGNEKQITAHFIGAINSHITLTLIHIPGADIGSEALKRLVSCFTHEFIRNGIYYGQYDIPIGRY